MSNAYPPLALALTYLASLGAFNPEEPFKVVGQMSGADSLVESPSILIAKNQTGWNDVWQKHRQTALIGPPGTPQLTGYLSDKPNVDFDKNVVLCVFGGQSRNICGFTVAETGLAKGTLVIRLQAVPLPNGAGTGVLQNPYVMLVLPRTKKKLQIQLDQTLLGGQGWKVLGDFGPTSEN